MGIDTGTSSVKVAVAGAATKHCLVSLQHPETEAVTVELYIGTDAGLYTGTPEVFRGIKPVAMIEPDGKKEYEPYYCTWLAVLHKQLM